MVNYAYRECGNKGSLIFAKDCNSTDNNKVFYCPYCDATMSVCAINSNIVNTYFKSSNHSVDCALKNVGLENINNYKIDSYSTEQVLSEIINSKNISGSKKRDGKILGNSETVIQQISTIRTLYSLCKNYPIDFKIGKEKICNILCDKRSFDVYKAGIKGARLVECKYVKNKVAKDHCMVCEVEGEGNKKIELLIYVSDVRVANKVKKKIRPLGRIVVLAHFGVSKYNTNESICYIKNYKQIVPLK